MSEDMALMTPEQAIACLPDKERFFVEAVQRAGKPAQQMDALLSFPAFTRVLEPTLAAAWGGLDKFHGAMMQLALQKPDLLKLDRASLYASMLECGRLGLSPTGQTDGGWIIPRKGKAVFQISFSGVLQVVRRAVDVVDVHADVVRADDTYEVDRFNRARMVSHKYDPKALEQTRGDIVAAWCAIHVPRGGLYLGTLSGDDISKIRRCAPNNSEAWRTWEGEMIKRSALVRGAKYAPKTSNDFATVGHAMAREMGFSDDDEVDPTVIDITGASAF